MDTSYKCVSKITTCAGCLLYRERKCNWFYPPKSVPVDVVEKGCKFRKPKVKEIYTTKTVAYLIDLFDGELI